MIYLEMSRDEQYGGGTWGFTNCIWAPTEKKGVGGSWPFSEKVLQVREGDIIIHLRGKPPNAYFVGYAIASSDGFRIAQVARRKGIVCPLSGVTRRSRRSMQSRASCFEHPTAAAGRPLPPRASPASTPCPFPRGT